MNIKLSSRKLLWTALLCAGLAGTARAATVNVPQLLSGTNNWYRTNEYILNGASFVRSNGVLNIEAGTVIKGHNLGTFGTNIAALYICRGAKIYAEGTAKHPIIFTADVDDITLPDDLGLWQRGLWGGVVVLGQTTINGALNSAGNAANPKFEVYEGLDENLNFGGEFVFRYGGNDDNDNSGIIRYVSIRHGGAKLSTDKEINGLSLGAVGRGTVVEYVEAYAIADDGFEFFGGTVNTKYLVSAFCDDDAFDVDMGYRGTNQFWFGIQAPDARNYGMELNNQINEIATTNMLLPLADFKVYNATLIGCGVLNTNVTGGRNAGLILRPYSAPKIYNSIFTDFNERGIELDTRNGINGDVSVTNGLAQFHNTLWWNFVTGSGNQVIGNTAANLARNTVATNFWLDTTLTNQIADPQLMGIARSNDVGYLDPRPATGSPAYTDSAATPNDGYLTPVNYRGAFGSNDLWIANWTALAEYGILAPAAINAVNVPQTLPGTTYWYRSNVYVLHGASFVLSNSVLHIEAGTVIKGHNLGTFGTNVAALYICRGAKIYAEGTPQNPIIFTAEADDTTLPDDLGVWQRGLWGGLVVFGQTTINGALNSAGNAANPKYEVYEGLDENLNFGGEFVFRYGGNDDNDNSGIIRYVSIRHGGAKLSTDKEINGLSLGAVGRGTTIEFVEAYAIADDGFEFFGGTVNTKYLVSAFCDDDAFDVDMGYRGINQFWFGIQAPDARNYGMELNNQINEIATTNMLTPLADFKVINATLIGCGVLTTNVTGGRNAGIILRPYAAPKIYNSVFTDFNERGIELDTRNGINGDVSVTNGLAQLHNTAWWDFVTGSGNQIIGNTAANLGRNTVATNYWLDLSLTNEIGDPLLVSIARTNDSKYLDPRPRENSFVRVDWAADPGQGSPIVISAHYMGAFDSGRSQWISDWTALGEYSIVGGAGGINPLNLPSSTPIIPPPNAPVLSIVLNGANVDIGFDTQLGYLYQLQTNSVMDGVWGNSGLPLPGTGTPALLSVPASAAETYFRVLAY
jgi:hypothetical protein